MFLVLQFPYQKKAFTFLGLVFYNSETNHKKRLKVNHWGTECWEILRTNKDSIQKRPKEIHEKDTRQITTQQHVYEDTSVVTVMASIWH